MDTQTKLYVFHKKEVALIFIFMILIAITSFVFGVRVGKNYAYDLHGVTKEDREKVVELLSAKEEELNSLKENPESHTVESSDIENKLQEKISEEFGGNGSHPNQSMAHDAQNHTPVDGGKNDLASKVKDQLSGKLTIQLGSHRTLKEAEEFALGFKARGYDPIINQIEIKGKGTWYRVSLGAFKDNEEAKNYIQKEKSLFMGQDFTIVKMP